MTNIFKILPFFVAFTLFFGCTKQGDRASNDSQDNNYISINPVIAGAVSAYRDTVENIIGNVTILYSKTEACYPSNEIFAFTVKSTNLPNKPIYKWKFGDDDFIKGGSTIGYMFKTQGSYTVIANIYDTSENLISSTSINVNAKGQMVTPHASFYAQLFDINNPNLIHFNANGTTLTNGYLSSLNYVWGDGEITKTLIKDNVPHYFPSISRDTTYEVRLIATSSSGCSDTALVPIFIAASFNITGDFTAQRFDSCTNEYFIFSSNILGNPQNCLYEWDFGDGTGYQTGNPIRHSFTYSNIMDVKMYVKYEGKTIYTINKSVQPFGFNVKPKALFTKQVSWEDNYNIKWAFNSNSILNHGEKTGYRWNLGNKIVDDFATTFIENLYPKTNIEQIIPIQLIVTGQTGCKDTASTTITIPSKI